MLSKNTLLVQFFFFLCVSKKGSEMDVWDMCQLRFYSFSQRLCWLVGIMSQTLEMFVSANSLTNRIPTFEKWRVYTIICAVVVLWQVPTRCWCVCVCCFFQLFFILFMHRQQKVSSPPAIRELMLMLCFFPLHLTSTWPLMNVKFMYF